MSEKPKKALQRMAKRLEAIGGQLRERAQLATDEAKAAWDRAHLERITGEIASARDDTRLQLHLARLDAKDAWKDTTRMLEKAREQASREIEETVHELAERVHRVAALLRQDEAPASSGEGGGAPGPKP
jgi:hypothetical protein